MSPPVSGGRSGSRGPRSDLAAAISASRAEPVPILREGQLPSRVLDPEPVAVEHQGRGGVAGDEGVPTPALGALHRLEQDARTVAGDRGEQADRGGDVGEQLRPHGDERPVARERVERCPVRPDLETRSQRTLLICPRNGRSNGRSNERSPGWLPGARRGGVQGSARRPQARGRRGPRALDHAQAIFAAAIVAPMVHLDSARSTACYVWRLMRREGVAQDQGRMPDASSRHLGIHRARDRARDPGSRVVRGSVRTPPKIHVAGIDRSGRTRWGRADRGSQARSSGKRLSDRSRQRRGSLRSGPSPKGSARADRHGAGLRRRPRMEIASPGDPTGALGEIYHLAAVNVRMAFYDRAGVELDPPRPLENLDGRAAGCSRGVRSEGGLRPVSAALPPGVPLGDRHPVVHLGRGDPGGVRGHDQRLVRAPHVGGPGRQQREAVRRLSDDRVHGGPGHPDHEPVRLLARAGHRRVRLRADDLHPEDAALRLLGAGRPDQGVQPAQTKDPDGSQAFTIVPTVSFGGSPTTQFMASLDFNGSTGKLILWRLKAGERRAQAHTNGGLQRPDGRIRDSDGSAPGTPRASTTTGIPVTSGSRPHSGTAISDCCTP